MSLDRDGSNFTGRSAPPSEDRALMNEKLAASKRKNAALQDQLKVLEAQVSELTTKMASLHQHHKASLIDVQEQTRHAVEESHARVLAELDAQRRIDISLARQTVEDQLAAERTFHTSVAEKIAALQSMFPDVYPAVEKASLQSTSDPLASPLSLAMSTHDARHAHHPNSASRLALTAFFENTRRALNTSRHIEADRNSMVAEIERSRRDHQAQMKWRHLAERALASADRRAADFLADLGEGGAARKEREEIKRQVRELEEKRAKRMQRDVSSGASHSALEESRQGHAAASSSSTAPSPARATPPRTAADPLPRTSARPDSAGPRSSFERRPHDEPEEDDGSPEEDAEFEDDRPSRAPSQTRRSMVHSPALGSVAEEPLNTSGAEARHMRSGCA